MKKLYRIWGPGRVSETAPLQLFLPRWNGGAPSPPFDLELIGFVSVSRRKGPRFALTSSYFMLMMRPSASAPFPGPSLKTQKKLRNAINSNLNLNLLKTLISLKNFFFNASAPGRIYIDSGCPESGGLRGGWGAVAKKLKKNTHTPPSTSLQRQS